jgi:hypothetical protein
MRRLPAASVEVERLRVQQEALETELAGICDGGVSGAPQKRTLVENSPIGQSIPFHNACFLGVHSSLVATIMLHKAS